MDGDVGLSRAPGPQICEPKGDARFWLVAAASILAKIYRDNVMTRAAKDFPEYGWDRNKGYTGGSLKDSVHVKALVEYGLTHWHREKPCRTILDKL